MSYIYEYAENFKQFGMIHFILKFTDSNNILPEINIPIVIDENQFSEEKIKSIADKIINSYNSVEEIPVEEVPVEEVPVEEVPVEEVPVEEIPVEEVPVEEVPVEEVPVITENSETL